VAFIEKDAIGIPVNPVTAMPCTVTAFGVKIASPGGAGMELTIVRDAIREWNGHYAWQQKRVLLPIEGDTPDASCSGDMLIAFFCGAQDSPSERATAFAAEVEKQVHQGHPALVYFSDGRADLMGDDVSSGRAMSEFGKRFPTAAVDSYGDEKELRAKFARQLEITIANHVHFKAKAPELAEILPAIEPAHAPQPKALSMCAQTILVEACDDFEAYIGRIKAGGMLKIQANGKQLVTQQDPASIEKWDGAFQELLANDFIHDAGCNGQLFQISTAGFAFLKSIGKSPVGYIAELGGM
jgi:hypothetical protein